MVTNRDITVIIPTISGREQLLERAVKSCRDQTAGEPVILVAYDSNRAGPAVTRNNTIENVTTKWLLFLDDDDYLYDDYIETVLPKLQEDFDVVYTWCDKNFRANFDYPFSPDLLRVGNYIPITSCVRTELFREVGGFPTDIAYEDWGLWLRLLDVGAKFKCIHQRKWMYEKQPENRTDVNKAKIKHGELKEV